MSEQLKGRIAWVEKAETVEVALAAAQALGSTAPRSSVEKVEAAEAALSAAEALADLHPHFTAGPGRRLGLSGPGGFN